jgi:hypothetical protein
MGLQNQYCPVNCLIHRFLTLFEMTINYLGFREGGKYLSF